MMNQPKAAIEGVSIVLVGAFNPAIFQPAWFAAQDLISMEEANDAKIEMIQAEVSVFSLDWLNVQVLRDRFIASTVQPPSFAVLRDFVVGAFTILQHTPVNVLGLNYEAHFEVESEKARQQIGKRLAPPGPWEAVLEDPVLRSLMIEGARTDGKEGVIRVKVEPSARLERGVYMNVNDHYVVGVGETPAATAESAVQIVREQWAGFLERPDEVANAIFGARE